MKAVSQTSLIGCALFVSLMLMQTSAAETIGPNDWLNRMASAVQTTDYEGTVVRLQNGKAEALKVFHKVIDGVVHEKIIVQDGNGLEIIRNGNEVHCILPDSKSVLVEEWNDQSTLFSTLPASDIRFGSEYDVSIVRRERVAGRKTVLLAIRPHDTYRFGHRLWLDIETAFPLQTELIAEDGTAIEQVKFADISFDEEIRASALLPSYSTDDFRWFTEPPHAVKQVAISVWRNDNLPPGFRMMSTHQEELASRDETVTHILYSDGLASVSVFIVPKTDKKISRRSRVGLSNSFSVETAEHHVTAVGEVPAATVEQIATSMQPR